MVTSAQLIEIQKIDLEVHKVIDRQKHNKTKQDKGQHRGKI